jgi:hypothetical protein
VRYSSRTLLIGLPLVAVLLGWVFYEYGYVRVETEVASLRETQAVKEKTLQKYLSLIARKPELDRKLASLKELRNADESKLIQGQTPTLAAAALQNTVKGMLTGRGGTISSERVEKPEDLGKFKVITISIDAVLPDVKALSEALYSIETQTPYLMVSEVDSRVRNIREPRELMVRLKVSGITGAK